ncbi:MAG: Crp/Fnr family transcriptional regulator [Flavobacteriales bacterium]|nr:Crp/Fnr family transcriptional regulator [Flavobacteriales bacterium]
MGSIWYFENVNLFDILCPHKFAEFQNDARHFRVYDKNEQVYFNDDAADTIYLVASGRVKIVQYTEDGEEVVKGVLERGEIFGEMALLGETRRTEVAQVVEEGTTLCPVNIEMMQDLMKDNQEFTLRIYKMIGIKMKKLERRIDNLVFKDVRARLEDFIQELADEKGVKQDNGAIKVTHYFTHKNIANLIGTSRQTVTTLLNELRDQGVLDFDRRSFLLKSKA